MRVLQLTIRKTSAREKSRIDPDVLAREKTSDRGKLAGDENREGEKPIALVRQAGSRWWACWLGYT